MLTWNWRLVWEKIPGFGRTIHKCFLRNDLWAFVRYVVSTNDTSLNDPKSRLPVSTNGRCVVRVLGGNARLTVVRVIYHLAAHTRLATVAACRLSHSAPACRRSPAGCRFLRPGWRWLRFLAILRPSTRRAGISREWYVSAHAIIRADSRLRFICDCTCREGRGARLPFPMRPVAGVIGAGQGRGFDRLRDLRHTIPHRLPIVVRQGAYVVLAGAIAIIPSSPQIPSFVRAVPFATARRWRAIFPNVRWRVQNELSRRRHLRRRRIGKRIGANPLTLSAVIRQRIVSETVRLLPRRCRGDAT